jgi:hypothetical protein
MLFEVRVVDGHAVEITESGEVISRRTISFEGADPRVPIASLEERQQFDAAQPSARLCRTDQASDVEAYLDAFLAKRFALDDVEPMVTFGRYLFASLIGGEAWTKIRERARGVPIELALSWGSGSEDLAAFPWEAMHDGERFLTQHTNVGIVRRVSGGAAIDEQHLRLPSPPRVLIVVGTEPGNKDIRAGVEYLRLIQALRDANLDLALQTSLLVEASVTKLQHAIRHLRPDVVHFICHGGTDPKGAFLELVDDEDKNSAARRYAAQIATGLQAEDGSLPRVVVITACESATVPRRFGQIATPLAADLVKAGVPLVVGMAGRVADQACRLFTRRFYEALLTSGDVTHATAQGRRAAIAGGRSEPKSSVDWALPVLFFSESVRTTRLPVTLNEQERDWHAVAAEYQPTPFPAFCDRATVTSRFDVLNCPEPTQKLLRGKPFQALLLNVAKGDEKYGCTRLLLELAAKAIRDGHIVCVVAEPKSEISGAPASVPQMIDRIVDALDQTVINFKLSCPACKLSGVEFRGAKGDCPECAGLRAVYTLSDGALKFEDQHLEMLQRGDRTATTKAETQRRAETDVLRAAFVKVAELARLKRPEAQRESMRLVLFVDDLHATAADAVAALLDHYLSTRGLRYAPNTFRMVLGFSSAARPEDGPGVPAVTAWLGRTNWVERVEIDRFTGIEELAAYEHFLLHWQDPVTQELRPLTVVPERRDQVMTQFTQHVAGIPSRLAKSNVVQTFFAAEQAWALRILEDADDDAVLTKVGGKV